MKNEKEINRDRPAVNGAEGLRKKIFSLSFLLSPFPSCIF